MKEIYEYPLSKGSKHKNLVGVNGFLKADDLYSLAKKEMIKNLIINPMKINISQESLGIFCTKKKKTWQIVKVNSTYNTLGKSSLGQFILGEAIYWEGA